MATNIITMDMEDMEDTMVDLDQVLVIQGMDMGGFSKQMSKNQKYL